MAEVSEDDISIRVLESKIDNLMILLDERLKGIDHKIEFGDRSALQTVQILAESVHRIENNQVDLGRSVRALEPLALRVSNLETGQSTAAGRLALLERDRAKLVGFLLGAAATGGGIGAAVAQLLGG